MKKGFTLLELLIVLTLTVVLVLGTIIGVGTYIYNITHKTNAQTEEVIQP